MHTYKLKFLSNEGDMKPKAYMSARKVEAGDVIQLDNGNWHCVTRLQSLKTVVQLVLAESGQSAQQAALLAKQSSGD